MHRLTKAQISARKKRRARSKEVRVYFKLKLKEVIREYNSYRSLRHAA